MNKSFDNMAGEFIVKALERKEDVELIADKLAKQGYEKVYCRKAIITIASRVAQQKQDEIKEAKGHSIITISLGIITTTAAIVIYLIDGWSFKTILTTFLGCSFLIAGIYAATRKL